MEVFCFVFFVFFFLFRRLAGGGDDNLQCSPQILQSNLSQKLVSGDRHSTLRGWKSNYLNWVSLTLLAPVRPNSFGPFPQFWHAIGPGGGGGLQSLSVPLRISMRIITADTSIVVNSEFQRLHRKEPENRRLYTSQPPREPCDSRRGGSPPDVY